MTVTSNITNAQLAAQIQALIQLWQTRETQMVAWLAGTAGGGSYSNGTYPLSDAYGNTAYVESPAQMQSDVTNTVNSATTQANAAAASATAAATSASNAVTARNLASTYATNAAVSATQSSNSQSNAASSAAAALASQNASAASASAAATSAANSANSATASASSASAAATSATAASNSASAAAASATQAATFNPALFAALTGATFTGSVAFNGGLSANTGTVSGAFGISTSLGVMGGGPNPPTKSTYDATLSSDANGAYLQAWNGKPLFLNSEGNPVYVGGTNGSSLTVYGDGGQPLKLITNSAAPFALSLSRSDLGSGYDARVWNNSGTWQFSAAAATSLATVNIGSGFGPAQGGAELHIQRDGSTANAVGNGPSLQLDDMATGGQASILQQSGGQTEIWQIMSGAWTQVARFDNGSGSMWLGAGLVVPSSIYFNESGSAKLAISQEDDGWLRFNQDGNFPNGTYTPYNFRADGLINIQNFVNLVSASSNTTAYPYGSLVVGGNANQGYFGVVIDDGSRRPVFMSNGVDAGVYSPGNYWLWVDTGSLFEVRNPVTDSNGNAYLHHANHTSGVVTLSTAAPSGGNDGDIWIQY